MLTTHQRTQVAVVGVLIQLELAETNEPESFLDRILEVLETEEVLEGNA